MLPISASIQRGRHPDGKKAIMKKTTERQVRLVAAESIEQIGAALLRRPHWKWFMAILPALAVFFAGLGFREYAEWIEPVSMGLAATILLLWLGFRLGIWTAANVCLEIAKMFREKAEEIEEKIDA